jgi:hypothetical protein
MSADELVKAIEQSGGTVTIAQRDVRLHYRLPANVSPLLDELRRMKPEVIPVLRRRSFLHLVPFLGRQVWSPAGPGKLLVLRDYATVGFADGSKMRWYDPTAVIPYA